MKYHLVYRKNGRYDPVPGDVEPGFETIDQGALDHTSQPTEVYLEVPRFLEASTVSERNFETPPVPFTAPAKEFRPFSRDYFNQNLQAEFPNITSPYNVFDDQTDTKFKLPISEEYDPDGTKIDGRLVEERIIKKIREHTTKPRKEENAININKDKPKSKGKRKSVTFKEVPALDVKESNGIETIKSTANSLVEESLERAVTVAQEIIKEINTELNDKAEIHKTTGKNAFSRVDSQKQESFSSNTTKEETCDVPKSVKESIEFYEAIDSQVDNIVKKEEKVEDERKLFLIQEIEESIEAGTVRKKSDIFNKDTVTVPCTNLKTNEQKVNTAKNDASKAFSIGSQTIKRLKKIAEKSFTSKSLFKTFILYMSNVFISLTKPFIFVKSSKRTFSEDKSTKTYCSKSKDSIHTDEETYLSVDTIQRRRKLSGSEMAQLSLKKPRELTQRMDTVITEFHKKLNITDTLSNEKCDEISKLSTEHQKFSDNIVNNTEIRRELNTFNSSEWVAKMSNDEREQVKKDIRLATLAAARRVAERRKTGEYHSYDNINELNIKPMDILTYIAIVESHVYTNKDAIFDDYISNLNKEYYTTEEREYKSLQSEYMSDKSYKMTDRSEIKTDGEEQRLSGISRVSEETNVTQESLLNTEYVATVKVEHKPAPFVSTVATHATRFEIHGDASEQKSLNVNVVEDKQIIVERKDETTIKAGLEKNVTIETLPVLVQELDEDQIEPLTITEVTEEAPIVTSETELSKAQVMGKETLRQISADFKEVESIQEENVNIIENKPELVVEDKNLAEALIINKAVAEDVSLKLNEITVEPIKVSMPKEESAVTSIEINELPKIKPIFNATIIDLDINFLIPEPFDGKFNYETEQIMPMIEEKEITKVYAHCVATVLSVTFESEETVNIIIETPDKPVANACVEPEKFSVATAMHTALSGQIKTDLFETHSLEIKANREEKVNSVDETKKFYKGLSTCTATCSDIIVPMINTDVLNVKDIKHMFATSNVEPQRFVTILPIAKPYLSEISVTWKEADIIETGQVHNSIQGQTARELVESAKFVTVHPICMAFGETVDTPLEESQGFKIAVVKEAICSLTEVPDRFTITLPVATHTYSTFNINYIEAEEIVIKQFKEKLAIESEEINKFITAQRVCTGKCKSINLEECKTLDVAEIKYRNPLERIEPTVYKTPLSLSTATAELFNMVLDEVALFEPEIFKKQIASTDTEVKNFVKIHALCQATEEQSTVVFKEPELKSLTFEVKELFAKETVELEKMETRFAISIAVFENLHVKLDSIENSQIVNFAPKTQVATSTIVPDVLKVAISTINDVVQATSTFHENVKTQVFKEAKIIRDEISSSESQQLAKALSIQKATLQDDYVSIETAHSENIEKTKLDYSHINAIQETGQLKSFEAVKQDVVLIAEDESEQKQRKKVIKRKTDTVKSKSAHMEIKEVASNVSILEKSEVKEADSYKEASYKVSQMKIGKEISSESIQQTLNLSKSYQLKQSQTKEEYQRQLLEMDEQLEQDSQIVIKDVTDTDKTSDESYSIQIVQEASDDIDSQRSLRELRLQSVEVEEIPEEIENVAPIENYTKWETARAAIDESAALTVVKKENIEITCPVLEVYEIEEDVESIGTEDTGITLSTKSNERKIGIKETDTQFSRGIQKHAVKLSKGAEMKKELKSIETNLDINKQENITSAGVAVAVSKEIKTEQLLTREQSSDIAQEKIVTSAVSQRHKSEALLTNQQSNEIALKMGTEHKYVQENIETSAVSQEFKSEEQIASTLAVKMDSRHEYAQAKVAKSIEARRIAQEIKSEEILREKSSKMALKTDTRQERGQEKVIKTIESSTEESPIAPPTPLIDEYIFRLVAPLPKSRSTTPVPMDPKPETSESSTHDDPRVVKKNLVPVVESEISENVQHSSPLPSPPTSPGHTPVYTKPGLNGGMKRLPRYVKPGLRGGSDRPSITQEEILEVRRKSSILASAITETLKNIERYKKDVGILKQEVASENQQKLNMESEETISNTKGDTEAEKTELEKPDQNADHVKLDEEDKDADKHKLENNIKETSGEQLQATSKPAEADERNVTPDRNGKELKATDVDEKYDNFSDALEEVTLVEDIVASKRDHSETIEECFDAVENEGQITEGVVEFPTEIVDEVKVRSQIAKELTPDRPENSSTKVDKGESKADEEVYTTPDEGLSTNKMVDITVDQAADEEVARVTALTPDSEMGVSKGRSPALSPRETELLKEAHVISLTRVLSAHMIRESLSPDPQRIIKNKEDATDKREDTEGEKDRSWTSFLQKSTRPGPGNLKHFADLQNKFEPKDEVVEKTEPRISTENRPKNFNSSPVPWQERALADSLGAPSVGETLPILTPEAPPEFLIAIPPVSGVKSQDVPRIKIVPTEAEDRTVKVSVDKIVEEALRVAKSLEIGEEKNRLIQLLSTNIKNITDSNFLVEDQLSKMRSQIQTLAQVPEIIKRALENLSEQLSVISQRRQEENIIKKKEVTTPQAIQESNKASAGQIPQQQIKKEIRKAEKMPAETRGAVTVTESTDKVTPQNRGKAGPHQPRLRKPEPMFGRLSPETGDLILPGGRRWRRNREYDEQSIAETILAQSEIIKGKALGINFMKYEKPPIPLDHLQRSEVYKLVHNVEQTPPKRVETLRPAIAEADYRERCRSLSPFPSDTQKDQKPSDQFQP